MDRRLWLLLLLVSTGAVACGGESAAERLQRGDQFLADNKRDEALVEYRGAVQADDRNPEARRKLGRALVAAGNIASGTDHLVRAADLLPGDAAAQLDAAKALLALGQFEDSKSRAEGVLRSDAKNVLAHIIRATAAAGLRDTEGALTDLESAVKLDPTRSASYVDLATLQAAQGKSAEAEAGFKQAIAVAPRSIEAHLALANYYWTTERPAEAEATLKRASEVDPKNVTVNLALANLYRGTGRGREAEAPLRRAVDASPADLRLQLSLADYYVAEKRLAEAKTLLKELATGPSAAAAGARLAAVEYEAGAPAEAHRMLDALIKDQPTNAQLLTLKGNWRLRERELEQALISAQAAVKVDPRSAEAHFLLGSVHLARNEADAAEKALTETLRLRPDAVDAQIALSNLNVAQGRASEGLTLSRQAVQSAPANAVARFTLARSLFANGDSAGALTQLRPVLAAAPNSTDALTLLGRIQQRQGSLDEARQSFNKALAAGPGTPDPLAALLNLELAAKRPQEAVRLLESQLAKTQPSAALQVLAGRTYAATGDLVKSEAALRKAIDVDPSMMEAYHVLGQIFVRQKRLGEAVKAYEERLSERPNDVGALTMVGMLQIVQGNRADARTRFEKVLDLDPRAAVASNNLAYMDAEAGTNLDVALNRAQTAKAALPDDADVNDTLGWVYVKRGLPALAVNPLEQAIAKSPSNPLYHYHLGVAHAQAGDRDRARFSLQKALQLSKSFDGAADAQRTLDGLGR